MKTPHILFTPAAGPRPVLRASIFGLVSLLGLCVADAATYTYNSGTLNTDWLTPANWTSVTFPGLTANGALPNGTTGDVAEFGVIAVSTVRINMSTASGSLSLGAIHFTNAMDTNTLTIDNSGGVAGVLTLNGATVNAVADTVISNRAGGATNGRLLTISGGANGMSVALSNPTNIVDGTSQIRINTAITGAGAGLTKEGAGPVYFGGGSAANTYSGVTTVNAGDLFLGKTSGTNAIAGNLKVGDGAGSQDGVYWEADNQIANSSLVELSGGSLLLNGRSEGSEGVTGVGALTLSASSIINFGSGNGLIQFAGITQSVNGTILRVNMWDTSDRLLFQGEPIDFTGQFSQSEVIFNSGAAGYRVEDLNGYYAIAAIPEPGTILGGIALVGLVGFRERRRLAGWVAPARKA